MHNTPASRASRHGSSKKQRSKQSRSHSTTPVINTVPLPEVGETMDLQTEAASEAYREEPPDRAEEKVEVEAVLEDVAGAEEAPVDEEPASHVDYDWFNEMAVPAQQPEPEEQHVDASERPWGDHGEVLLGELDAESHSATEAITADLAASTEAPTEEHIVEEPAKLIEVSTTDTTATHDAIEHTQKVIEDLRKPEPLANEAVEPGSVRAPIIAR